MTRRMMDWAKERNLNRILIVNKIDAEHVDLPKTHRRIEGSLR